MVQCTRVMIEINDEGDGVHRHESSLKMNKASHQSEFLT